MDNLLEDLAEVVRLCDGRTDAIAVGKALAFLRTHHAKMAEAVKDARRYQDMRIALYQENITVGEAELVLRVYGACPSIEQFDAAIDAQHNSAREGE